MPIVLFRGGSQVTPSETNMLSHILEHLQHKGISEEEAGALFFAYECNGRQIDATFIGRHAIVNIELKDIRVQEIRANAQGVLVDTQTGKPVLKAGRENPLNQIQHQNYALMNFIRQKWSDIFMETRALPSRRFDVGAVLVFRHLGSYDGSLYGDRGRYLQISDLDSFLAALADLEFRDFHDPSLPLTLPSEFAHRLAESLSLVKVDSLTERIHPQDLDVFRAYLQEIRDAPKGYVRRPALEDQISFDKNILLIGAPGSGKTYLMHWCASQLAQNVLGSLRPHRIPCVLSMRSQESIPDKLATLLRITDRTLLEDYLSHGLMWVVFDGIDEMVDFSSGCASIVAFMRIYHLCRFAVSVRGDYYRDRQRSADLRPFHDYLKIEIPQLNEEDSRLLLEAGASHLPESKRQLILSYLSSFPERTPLLVRMTIEIAEHLRQKQFESLGLFYKFYFGQRLLDECAKIGTPIRGAPERLVEVLTKLARDNQGKLSLSVPRSTVLQYLREAFGERAEDFLDLLMRAELLIPYAEGDLSEPQSGSPYSIMFAHRSYRDYFLAWHIASTTVDKIDTLLRTFQNSFEHQTIVLYCGLEQSQVVVNQLMLAMVSNAGIGLLISAMANTPDLPPGVVTAATSRLCRHARRGPYSARVLLGYIRMYGARICGASLTGELDEIARTDRAIWVQWEIIKTETLQLGPVPEDCTNTFTYQHYITFGRIADPHRPSRYDALIRSPLLQCEEGARLFHHIAQIDDLEALMDLAADTSYSPEVRSGMIAFLDEQYLGDQPLSHRMITLLRKQGQLFEGKPFAYRWELLRLFLNALGTTTDDMPLRTTYGQELIDYFWKEPDGLIQFRILYHVGVMCDDTLDFLIQVIQYYVNDAPAEANLFTEIAEEEFYIEEDIISGIEGYDRVAGDYVLNDFEGRPYTILMKCLAVELAGRTKDSRAYEFLLRMSAGEEQMIRAVALKSLRTVDES